MTVSILGCGWFGKALAKSLISRGVGVKGSTTSPEKLITLQAANIKAYRIIIGSPHDSIINTDFFLCDVLVVANNVKMEAGNYLEKIQTTISLILQNHIKKVIFISSTSVYGEPNLHVDENTLPEPATKSANLLLNAELLFQKNHSFSTSILRFGGLIGPGREPGKFLAGRKNVPNGLAPVNLIHLVDCIGIIEKIISADLGDYVINCVAPQHPTKQAFYVAATNMIGLQPPEFRAEKILWKIVESVYVEQLLHYIFKVTW